MVMGVKGKLLDSMNVFAYLYIILIFLEASLQEKVSMKIVDNPSNFGLQNNFMSQSSDQPVLEPRIHPSNFSGPPHLRRLYGKCFEKTDESYKYEFCPFFNVTQHEQSLRWNPYHGILGVWQEWEIENNTFTAMRMVEGDDCGDKQRSVRVLLQCGNSNGEIDKVTEPNTCQYELVFKTQLVCHPHSLLVYPTLSKKLRTRWDLLEGELADGEITLKGYKVDLSKIFEDAGYYLSKSKKESAVKAKEKQDKGKQEFTSLMECNGEYAKLKDEIEELKSLLQKNKDQQQNNYMMPNQFKRLMDDDY